MNAFKGTGNLKTSHLGISRNLNRSVNEGLIKMVKFPKKLSLHAFKRSRIMYVILMPASTTHHRKRKGEMRGFLVRNCSFTDMERNSRLTMSRMNFC
jgi:hypothetical protein